MENTEIINVIIGIGSILGVGAIVGAFKSIDWLISTKYRTKDDCEHCRNSMFEVINRDRDLLSRVDAKMDIVLEFIRGKNEN